jgi:hypothetical protein
LAEGVLPVDSPDDFDGAPDWHDGPAKVRTDDVRNAFEIWMRGRRHHGDLPTAESFGRDLKEVCAGMERTNQLRVKAERIRFYKLPSLSDCRADFEEWLDSKVEWA